MGSEHLIGALALGTLLLVIVWAVAHFGRFLGDSKNRDSAHNALVRDGKSATTTAQDGSEGSEHQGKTLKERLDQSAASAHPTTPKESQVRQ